MVFRKAVGVGSLMLGWLASRFNPLTPKVLWACGLLAATRLSAAQPASSRLVLTYDPNSEEQREALAAVRVHIRGSPVELVEEPVDTGRELADRLAAAGTLATSHAALGTFSIEQSADRSILVFFTEPGGNATLVRRLPASEVGNRVAIEQAAIVVRSLIQALLDGGRVDIVAKRDPALGASTAKIETPPSSAPPEVDPPQVFLLLGYVGAHPSGGLPWQSGMAAGGRWHLVPTAYVGARYTLFPASSVEGGGARVSITRQPGELFFGYAAGTTLLVNLELSAIVERSARETLATDRAFEPTPSRAYWTFGVGPRAGAIVAPSPTLRLAVRAGADFLTRSPEYATDERTVVAPGRIRPRLDVEVGVGVW